MESESNLSILSDDAGRRPFTGAYRFVDALLSPLILVVRFNVQVTRVETRRLPTKMRDFPICTALDSQTFNDLRCMPCLDGKTMYELPTPAWCTGGAIGDAFAGGFNYRSHCDVAILACPHMHPTSFAVRSGRRSLAITDTMIVAGNSTDKSCDIYYRRTELEQFS